MSVQYVDDASTKKAAALLEKREKSDILKDTGYHGIQITEDAIQLVPQICPEGWSKEQAELLQETHRELLRAVKEKPVGTEAGRIYNLDMTPISSLVIGENEEQKINIPKCHEPHVVIHNHPSGQTFSPGDINSFGMRFDTSVMTVVGNDGSVYILQKTEEYDVVGFAKAFGERFAKLPKKLTAREYVDIVNSFLKGAEQYGVQFITGR